MAQVHKETWTNAASAAARNINTGWIVDEITIVDETNGGSFYWNSEMADASILDVDSGTLTTTNGVTPLSQSATIGQAVSAFTNANPGVITVSDAATGGFAAGDTINVVALADDQSAANSLNDQYTIASVSGNNLTTATDTTSYSVYVSGGRALRVSDTNGDAVVQSNAAIRGVTLGTSAVGANSAVMSCVAKSGNFAN